MPRLVKELTETEKEIEQQLRSKFSEEQMCAFFLTRTIRSQYQFDDAFVRGWYQEIFDREPEQPENARRELVQAYTRMLMFENKYRYHLDYWLRQRQHQLIADMEQFFAGEPGK